LNRLQEEIDGLSGRRMELGRGCRSEEAAVEIARVEGRVQALALLMLHFCAGLQHVQDLEEIERKRSNSTEGQQPQQVNNKPSKEEDDDEEEESLN
jgi:hypothetical protein